MIEEPAMCVSDLEDQIQDKKCDIIELCCSICKGTAVNVNYIQGMGVLSVMCPVCKAPIVRIAVALARPLKL